MMLLTSGPQSDPAVLQQAGIRQWLTKPVRNSELYDRLMRLMAPPEAGVREEKRGQDGRTALASSKGRVLVVEDHALNQLVVEGVLTRLGYEVHSVSNGADALDAMGIDDYSAVLMDCHMPVMDGFTATRLIRRQENGHRTPIIAMTAGALSEDRERCLAAGMDDYISKPVDLEALAETLARWVPEAGDRQAALGGSSPSVTE
jgi:CheY-like chemotaxis protein